MDARLICIIGGGISGLTFAALWCKNGGRALVLEKNMPSADDDDGKSVVINAGSAQLLQRIGVDLHDAAPLTRLHARFENAPGGFILNNGILGYGIAHRDVQQQIAAGLGDGFCAPATVTSITPHNSGVHVDYRTADGVDKTAAATAALIACELPQLPPPFVARDWDYGQALISFAAAAHNFLPGDAVECFCRYGIIAIVPRADQQKGVIVCAKQDMAGQLSAKSDVRLLECINDVFGGEFGLHSPSARVVYAPRGRQVSPLAAERIAVLGAGATILHPAGAQGINLGLSDAACLATLLNNTDDIESALAAYHRRRTPVHIGMLAATSFLAAGVRCRQLPFRIGGGTAAATLAAVAAPFHKHIIRRLSGLAGGDFD